MIREKKYLLPVLLGLSLLFILVSESLAQVSLDFVLAVDESGSMETTRRYKGPDGTWRTANDPNRFRIWASQLFIELCSPNDKIALVGFGRGAEVKTGFLSSDNPKLLKAVHAIRGDHKYTDIRAGLLEAYLLLDRISDSGMQNHLGGIILLTDGVPEAEGPSSFSDDRINVMKLVREISDSRNKYPIFPVMLGEYVDDDLMHIVARMSGGQCYPVKQASDLCKIYKDIFVELTNRFAIKGKGSQRVSIGPKDRELLLLMAGDVDSSSYITCTNGTQNFGPFRGEAGKPYILARIDEPYQGDGRTPSTLDIQFQGPGAAEIFMIKDLGCTIDIVQPQVYENVDSPIIVSVKISEGAPGYTLSVTGDISGPGRKPLPGGNVHFNLEPDAQNTYNSNPLRLPVGDYLLTVTTREELGKFENTKTKAFSVGPLPTITFPGFEDTAFSFEEIIVKASITDITPGFNVITNCEIKGLGSTILPGEKKLYYMKQYSRNNKMFHTEKFRLPPGDYQVTVRLREEWSKFHQEKTARLTVVPPPLFTIEKPSGYRRSDNPISVVTNITNYHHKYSDPHTQLKVQAEISNGRETRVFGLSGERDVFQSTMFNLDPGRYTIRIASQVKGIRLSGPVQDFIVVPPPRVEIVKPPNPTLSTDVIIAASVSNFKPDTVTGTLKKAGISTVLKQLVLKHDSEQRGLFAYEITLKAGAYDLTVEARENISGISESDSKNFEVKLPPDIVILEPLSPVTSGKARVTVKLSNIKPGSLSCKISGGKENQTLELKPSGDRQGVYQTQEADLEAGRYEVIVTVRGTEGEEEKKSHTFNVARRVSPAQEMSCIFSDQPVQITYDVGSEAAAMRIAVSVENEMTPFTRKVKLSNEVNKKNNKLCGGELNLTPGLNFITAAFFDKGKQLSGSDEFTVIVLPALVLDIKHIFGSEVPDNLKRLKAVDTNVISVACSLTRPDQLRDFKIDDFVYTVTGPEPSREEVKSDDDARFSANNELTHSMSFGFAVKEPGIYNVLFELDGTLNDTPIPCEIERSIAVSDVVVFTKSLGTFDMLENSCDIILTVNHKNLPEVEQQYSYLSLEADQILRRNKELTKPYLFYHQGQQKHVKLSLSEENGSREYRNPIFFKLPVNSRVGRYTLKFLGGFGGEDVSSTSPDQIIDFTVDYDKETPGWMKLVLLLVLAAILLCLVVYLCYPKFDACLTLFGAPKPYSLRSAKHEHDESGLEIPVKVGKQQLEFYGEDDCDFTISLSWLRTYHIEPGDGKEVFLEDELIHEDHPLNDEDVIKVGDTTVTFTLGDIESDEDSFSEDEEMDSFYK